MELVGLVDRTHEAMERGDYHAAAALCQHAIEHVPSFLTAHRLLAECKLELRDVDGAIELFQSALNFDPMNVVCRLGMGVAAEDKRDIEAAYACYLHAWEINPGLDHVRDRLVELRRALGVDPRLHLTRAGLASVHLRAGQSERAIAELRRLVDAEPQARRARCALAEALWRGGDDAGAIAVCREGLEQAPENGRFLAILGEIEHRLQTPGASAVIERLQAIDPLGEIATLMSEWRLDRDLTVLLPVSTSIPEPKIVIEPVQRSPRSGVAAFLSVPAAVEEVVPVPQPEPQPVVTLGVAGLDQAIQPFIWNDASPPTVPVQDGAAAWDDWRNPVPAEAAIEPVLAATANPHSVLANEAAFVTSDGQLDLTAGWDGLDQILADATPPAVQDDRYSALFTELQVGGFAPFDAPRDEPEDAAWEPLFADELDTVAAVAPAASSILAEPVADVHHVVGLERALASAPPAIDPVAEVDEFADLAPFCFDEPLTASSLADDGAYDFSELDLPAAPLERSLVAPAASRSSSPVGPAVQPMPAHGSIKTNVFARRSKVATAAALTGPPAVFKPSTLELEPALAAPSLVASSLSSAAPAVLSVRPVTNSVETRATGSPLPLDGKAGAVASSPASAFHVEHSTAANARIEPAPGMINRDELTLLRIRLIEERNSAGEIVRTLETKLNGRRPDPSTARVLGEAYLQLGQSDQAAAQFRLAMLANTRVRASNAACP